MIALTRQISEAIVRCELTHLAREPIDLALALAQHEVYERCLSEAGCRVERLPTTPDLPDSVFIEDTAVVLDELAIVTRLGANSRRLETSVVAQALKRYRPLHVMREPGTMDGGDVLVAGRRVFVARSSRTNESGIDQFRRAIVAYGYELVAVDVRGCLHLKSAETMVGEDVVLLNRDGVSSSAFSSFETIEVHPDEPSAANALMIGNQIIGASAFPRTLERLQRRGLHVTAIDASEVAKAEGALTCCSLIIRGVTPYGMRR